MNQAMRAQAVPSAFSQFLFFPPLSAAAECRERTGHAGPQCQQRCAGPYLKV